MSISLSSSLSSQQAAYNSTQQTQQNYKNLFTALSSGNLQLAQSSLQKLNFSAATLKSNAMLSQISTALNNGDLATAQNAINGKSASSGLMAAIAAEDAQENASQSDPLLQPSAITQTSSTTANTSSTNTSTNATTHSASTALGLGNVLDLMA